MNEEFRNAVDAAFIDSISEMGFIDVASCADIPIDSIINPLPSRIKVMMPFLQDIVVVFPESIVLNMKKNLFADSIDEPSVYDTVYEFLNVFAGRIFQIASPDMLFELSIPEGIDLLKTDLSKHKKHTYQSSCGKHIIVWHKLP